MRETAGASRERPTAAVQLPAALEELVGRHVWTRDTVGESGDAVYRLRPADDGAELFLKHGQGPGAVDLAGEMVKLRWLRSHVDVPAVRHFTATPDEAWLLIDAMPGQTAYELLVTHPDRRGSIVDLVATLLRRLHAIPVESCPFNSDHRMRLGEARWRIDHGLVDDADFDDERRGWSADQVWTAMNGLLPFTTEPVVTHGDYSLDNIVIAEGGTAGLIDVGRAGIADKYQDLAILCHCLGEFGRELQDRMFGTYGIARQDDGRIRFHLMLDDLF